MMRAHKLDAYIDGRKRIIFCSVCGQENDGLMEECAGKVRPTRRIVTQLENSTIIYTTDEPPLQFNGYIPAVPIELINEARNLFPTDLKKMMNYIRGKLDKADNVT